MFRYFENLVDPYIRYAETDAPPQRLWPFLRQYMGPFRGVFVVAALLTVLVAAGEIALIWYVGRIVDLLTSGAPAAVWARYWPEFLAAAIFVIAIRPIISGVDVALLHNTILPNLGTMIRWRAVLRSSRVALILPCIQRS